MRSITCKSISLFVLSLVPAVVLAIQGSHEVRLQGSSLSTVTVQFPDGTLHTDQREDTDDSFFGGSFHVSQGHPSPGSATAYINFVDFNGGDGTYVVFDEFGNPFLIFEAQNGGIVRIEGRGEENLTFEEWSTTIQGGNPSNFGLSIAWQTEFGSVSFGHSVNANRPQTAGRVLARHRRCIRRSGYRFWHREFGRHD